ncbi:MULTISPECIES: succinylglutamate desuccinylase [Dethiosulfovibrio]|uniref:Succinylglutamate desuccinylase n=2 Tax=Dethiosulfovibrio TaxID=47054 RepID=A0ABS9ENJ3_9BACT|nr:MULTISPECIES: succinylglutamate desuccinylase [Dethiosulfovibrio]MCF4114049.1 succinylglutamate desuccinylase [Dethiosulfovibrio russensis]MCF4142761.1 succinylglutamate desuccinylase [Dethiosulfovibrio marinus]MCF4144675.1 succinylglutamate desuccinylase [Dethiosulfovibrio acidaminovorans]
MSNLKTVKLAAVIAAGALVALSGSMFREHRLFKEPTVAGPGVTEVKKLGDFSPVVADTVNDCNVYILDSGVPGGTAFLIGGTHPEEPASNMAAQVFVENAVVEQGRLIVVTRANTSASQITRNGEAYPRFYSVKTPWGTKTWRMGDRCSNALDSWPDPEVYVHYPSGQNLAYMDIRNLNRTWPGRPDGLITERTNFAMMELIRNENVDLAMDYHEAELEYPVENTIVTHEKGQAVAAMTSMMLTSGVFPVPIGMEFSPAALHGLSHREIGDHSQAMSLLAEVAEPMLDRIRGITDEELLMTGKDRFVMKAGEHRLLYAPIDENGWHIDVRVGRHVTTFMTMLQVFNQTTPDRAVVISGIPSYQDVVDKGVGAFYHDPEAAPGVKVFYD